MLMLPEPCHRPTTASSSSGCLLRLHMTAETKESPVLLYYRTLSCLLAAWQGILVGIVAGDSEYDDSESLSRSWRHPKTAQNRLHCASATGSARPQCLTLVPPRRGAGPGTRACQCHRDPGFKVPGHWQWQGRGGGATQWGHRRAGRPVRLSSPGRLRGRPGLGGSPLSPVVWRSPDSERRRPMTPCRATSTEACNLWYNPPNKPRYGGVEPNLQVLCRCRGGKGLGHHDAATDYE